MSKPAIVHLPEAIYMISGKLVGQDSRVVKIYYRLRLMSENVYLATATTPKAELPAYCGHGVVVAFALPM